MRMRYAALGRFLALTLVGLSTFTPAIGGGVPVHDVAAEATRLQQLTHLVDQLRPAQEPAGGGTVEPGRAYRVCRIRNLAHPEPGFRSARRAVGTCPPPCRGPIVRAAPILRDRLREEFQLEIEASPSFSGSAAGNPQRQRQRFPRSGSGGADRLRRGGPRPRSGRVTLGSH